MCGEKRKMKYQCVCVCTVYMLSNVYNNNIYCPQGCKGYNCRRPGLPLAVQDKM